MGAYDSSSAVPGLGTARGTMQVFGKTGNSSMVNGVGGGGLHIQVLAW